MAALMDRLLHDGWFLVTWQVLDDWPDTWALIRDWKPTDPANNPTDPMHLMQYGTAIVRDLVGFCSDGTAVARRISLEDHEISPESWSHKSRRRPLDDITRWSLSGPTAETVNSAIALAAPEDCCRDDDRRSDLPWGSTTTQILALFCSRDWRLLHSDEGGDFQYAYGVGSTDLDRPRFRHHGQKWDPLGIIPLSCYVSPAMELRITGWRVHTGCEAHRGVRERVGFHTSGIDETLGRFELSATGADLAALAYCVVYGDCSTHELDMSKEYPTDPDAVLKQIDALHPGEPR